MSDEVPGPEVTIFTVGHSNYPIEVLLDLLKQHQIELIVDVRSSPYSGYASQFNRETIQASLLSQGIKYLFLGDIIGGRPRGDEFYDDRGYALYDRLAESSEFQRGIERLLDASRAHRTALLCGEEDPTECHRRLLIGRVLAGRGVAVLHIRGDGRIQSEEQIAKEEQFAKTKGQMSLFDLEDPPQWTSTQSASPKKKQPNFLRF